jgi:hypothetical protein
MSNTAARRIPYHYADDDRPIVSAPVAARASRVAGQRQTKAQRRAPITDDIGHPIYEGEYEPTTAHGKLRADQQSVTGTQPAPRSQGGNPLVWIGVGMLLVLVMWSLCVHIGAWYANTFQDPGYYTQSSHRDAVTVTDGQGHQYRASGFIDPQNHIDLLVLPVGDDASKARIIVGPKLDALDDPQHATITARARGTVVTILVQGPYVANWYDLMAGRQQGQWLIDVSQQSKGASR